MTRFSSELYTSLVMLVPHPAVEWLDASICKWLLKPSVRGLKKIILTPQLELSNRALDEVSLESANEKPSG